MSSLPACQNHIAHPGKIMKNTLKLLSSLALLFPLLVQAQAPAPLAKPATAALLTEINKDIWTPFVDGVNKNMPALYNGINSKDFYWVAAGQRSRIMNLQEYIDDAKVVISKRTGQAVETHMEVRFLERHINAEFASEKVITKFVSKEPGKAAETSYGVNQIFSRKEGGTWKKLIQQVNVSPASAGIFAGAAPM